MKGQWVSNNPGVQGCWKQGAKQGPAARGTQHSAPVRGVTAAGARASEFKAILRQYQSVWNFPIAWKISETYYYVEKRASCKTILKT